MRVRVVLAALALAGCASGDGRLEKLSSICRAYGFTPGTDLFGSCMMKQAEDHPTFAQTLKNMGASLAADSGGGDLDFPARTTPSATRLGGPAFGMCMKTSESMAATYRVCYYKCGQSPAVLNVGLGELCPLSPN